MRVIGTVPIQAFFPKIAGPIRIFPPVGLVLKNGDELLRLPAIDRPTDYENAQFTFEPALGEVIKGHALIPVIEELREAVLRIISALSPFLR
jgi:hypothetical protein